MRPPKAIAMLSLLVGASTLLLACGGSGKLSKSETIKKASAICRRATDQARQFAAGRQLPSTPEGVNRAVEEDSRIARQAHSELKRIKPGSDGRASFDRFVSAQGGIVKANTDQLAAVKAGDREKFQASVEDLLNATGAAKKAADAYGLDGCPYDPVSVQLAHNPVAQAGTGTAQSGVRSSSDAVGHWTGEVTQYGPGNNTLRYNVLMNVTSDAPGAVVGTTRYPSLACGGEIQLRGTQDTRYVYRERITFGRKLCFDGGTIFATVSGSSMSWRWVGRGSEVLGVLRRAG
jgi:hypothetical protein